MQRHKNLGHILRRSQGNSRLGAGARKSRTCLRKEKEKEGGVVPSQTHEIAKCAGALYWYMQGQIQPRGMPSHEGGCLHILLVAGAAIGRCLHIGRMSSHGWEHLAIMRMSSHGKRSCHGVEAQL